jgi:hypothetical protein
MYYNIPAFFCLVFPLSVVRFPGPRFSDFRLSVLGPGLGVKHTSLSMFVFSGIKMFRILNFWCMHMHMIWMYDVSMTCRGRQSSL